jgi:putative restriction endonuclease
LFIIQRCRDSLESFRLILVRQTDPAFIGINEVTGGRRWGGLDATRRPITQQEIAEARVAMISESRSTFVPIQPQIRRETITRTAIARDTAFRDTLLRQYQRRCAVSGIGLVTQSTAEAQAAHVIPLGRGGPDEPRNGLLLTGTLHWAFDRGLFGVDADRRIIIPHSIQMMTANEWLRQYDGQSISEATVEALRTADEAFEWHRRNLVSQWL